VESAVQRVLSRMSRTRILCTQDVLTALAQELGGVPMPEEDDESGARKPAAR
jgi:hypothetical protein